MNPMSTDRADILNRMQQAMGECPGAERRVPLDPELGPDERTDGLVRRKLSFATEPGDRCTAWLIARPEALRPGAAPRPAMLCLHQTTKVGKDEPAGLGGLPNLHYAAELARRGYVTLSPDYPGYGGYRADAYALGYASATMKGIWNHMRAVDLLSTMPEVDAGRIGCIGHSLGGHNTLFAAAFDERIRLAVSSCGFTLFAWNDNEGRGVYGNVADWSHNGYMPRIRTQYECRADRMPFDFDDVLAAIAPRAVLVNATEGDSFRVAGVRECQARLAPLYARLGASDRLAFVYPPGGHDFPPAARETAYAFIDTCISGPPPDDSNGSISLRKAGRRE
jgi:hypothetical protein